MYHKKKANLSTFLKTKCSKTITNAQPFCQNLKKKTEGFKKSYSCFSAVKF